MVSGTNSEKRIIVGVDGSAQSKEALRWAARLAGAQSAAIEAVSAWHFSEYLGWAAVPEGYAPKTETEKLLTQTVDDVFGSSRPADLQLSVYEGDPAQVLVELSRNALMVVVGSRGRGALSGLLLGSVSTKLTQLAACPVLVVPASGSKPGAS